MISRTAAFLVSAAILASLAADRALAQGYPDRFNLVFGDMKPGSGLAAGVEYTNSHFRNGLFDLRLEAKVSIRLYQQHEVQLVLPHFLDRRWFAEVLGVYRSYTEVDYFGIGQRTPEEARANYQLDGTALFGAVGFRPDFRTAFGARVGTLRSNLSPGRSDDLPSVEEAFAPAELPGFEEEPDHLLFTFFTVLDHRNDRYDPTDGSYFELQATSYRDVGAEGFDFQELQTELRHFRPVTRRWTYALRVMGVFTWTGEGNEVPFYLLPSLGGTLSLHAFENDRFRDRNLLFLNNELRYQLTPEIRVKGFVDFGEVFPRIGDFRPGELALSTGIGAYYKLGRRVAAGVSLGAGHEGLRVSVTGDFRF